MGLGVIVPRPWLVVPVAARVVAVCQEDKDAQPDKTGDDEELCEAGRIADAHKDPGHYGSFAEGDQQRHYDVELAQIYVGYERGDESQEGQR